MKIEVHYFGMIAEYTNCDRETVELNEGDTVDSLQAYLHNKYSGLKKQTYQLAVNQTIDKSNTSLQQDDEVAVLPPFAGG